VVDGLRTLSRPHFLSNGAFPEEPSMNAEMGRVRPGFVRRVDSLASVRFAAVRPTVGNLVHHSD